MARPTRIVHLAGVTFGLVAGCPELERYLEWHFGRLPSSEAHPDLVIELRHGETATPAGEPSMYDGPVTRWEVEGGLRLVHRDGAGAVLADGRLTVEVAARSDTAWRAVRQLLFSSLSWFLEPHGLLVLHAAMLVRDGEAALVLGRTGGGKSTTALAGLLQGWELHSDDLVVAAERAARPVVQGIPKRVTVDPALGSRIPSGSEPLPGDPRGRLMLPGSLLRVGEVPVRLLVTAEHHPGEGALRHLGAADSLASVVPAFLESARPAVLRRRLGQLGRLAALPHHALGHAADPSLRTDRAAALLAEAWAASGEGTAESTGGPDPAHQ